jgi:hypothetical protein
MRKAERTIAPPPVYYYRRPLSLRETLPAVGVGVGAGLAAFYIVRLFFQRTPLRPVERRPAEPRALARPGRAGALPAR